MSTKDYSDREKWPDEDLLLAWGQAYVNWIAGGYEPRKQKAEILRRMKSLSREQAEMLLRIKSLSREQAELLRTIRDMINHEAYLG